MKAYLKKDGVVIVSEGTERYFNTFYNPEGVKPFNIRNSRVFFPKWDVEPYSPVDFVKVLNHVKVLINSHERQLEELNGLKRELIKRVMNDGR